MNFTSPQAAKDSVQVTAYMRSAPFWLASSVADATNRHFRILYGACSQWAKCQFALLLFGTLILLGALALTHTCTLISACGYHSTTTTTNHKRFKFHVLDIYMTQEAKKRELCPATRRMSDALHTKYYLQYYSLSLCDMAHQHKSRDCKA